MGAVSRRRLVAGVAWSVPLVVVGAPAAQAACSGPVTYYTPGLSVSSSTTTKDANGHTIGHMYFTIKNNGTTNVPAGTTYSVVLTAEKSPGSSSKDIVITPQSGGITPTGSARFNPDGTGGAVRSRSYSLVLPAALLPGETFVGDWYIDSETGIGATRVRMDATLVTYSTNSCGETTTGTSTTVSSYWGAK